MKYYLNPDKTVNKLQTVKNYLNNNASSELYTQAKIIELTTFLAELYDDADIIQYRDNLVDTAINYTGLNLDSSNITKDDETIDAA